MKQQHIPTNTIQQTNLETKISIRLRSIFSAVGSVISDFYLEAGIYFVGGFNALLVSWEIFIDMSVHKSHPFFYAVLAGLVAFIAVEGLAVYLVGAAAKTNNQWLWFFSIVFAGFFTHAHYQEMNNPGLIAQYITLAVPFFVVVGYWARTLKIEAESKEQKAEFNQESELARQQRIADEDRARQRQIEDQKLVHQMEMERLKIEAQNELKRLKIEIGKQPENRKSKPEDQTGNFDRKTEDPTGFPVENFRSFSANQKLQKAEILDRLPSLIGEGLTNVEIAKIVGRTERTVRDYRKQLPDQQTNGRLK